MKSQRRRRRKSVNGTSAANPEMAGALCALSMLIDADTEKAKQIINQLLDSMTESMLTDGMSISDVRNVFLRNSAKFITVNSIEL